MTRSAGLPHSTRSTPRIGESSQIARFPRIQAFPGQVSMKFKPRVNIMENSYRANENENYNRHGWRKSKK